jgi:hypothetical protein
MLKLVVTAVHTNVISVSVNNILHVTNYWGVSSINQALSWFNVVSRRPLTTNSLVGYQSISWHWYKIFSKHLEFSLSVPLH